ncbi:MAG TPA: VOC family protein, partial [Candidatus Limnocylindrales bacterium]|nr:VOC family protein [Candidatus Limnocylindrales bacterium]
MGSITGFFHGGITVSDMDRSLPFYRDGLGLEIEFDRILDGPYLREVLGMQFESLRAVYLRIPGGGFVELLEYRGLERFSAASRP